MDQETMYNIYGETHVAETDKFLNIIETGSVCDWSCPGGVIKEVVYYADGSCDMGYDLFDWTYSECGSYAVDHFQTIDDLQSYIKKELI